MATALRPDPWVPEDSFGGRLALVRQAMRWNVKEAADACGLNDQSWRNWEDGRKCRDLVAVAEHIHDATGVNLAWLVMGDGQVVSPSRWITTECEGQLVLLAA